MKETIYKRIFVIVLDSLGIGAMPDSEKFGDRDVDTFGQFIGRNQFQSFVQVGHMHSVGVKEVQRFAEFSVCFAPVLAGKRRDSIRETIIYVQFRDTIGTSVDRVIPDGKRTSQHLIRSGWNGR